MLRSSMTSRDAPSRPHPRMTRNSNPVKGWNVEGASEVGKLIAARAKDAGVSDVVFDRGAYLFHGRVKALAEAARESGLNF